MSITQHTVESFLDSLSSKAPTPGGGSVAALAGALAAGLVGMVCHLTLGKKKYRDVETDMETLLADAEELRRRLMQLMDDDVRVFTEYSNATTMPKSTETEIEARNIAIQAALKQATEVPMRIVDCATRVLDLCAPCAEKGNVWAVSDAGVAAILADAAAKSGALNVLINLQAIDDAEFVRQTRSELETRLGGIEGTSGAIYADVVARIERSGS